MKHGGRNDPYGKSGRNPKGVFRISFAGKTCAGHFTEVCEWPKNNVRILKKQSPHIV